MAQLALAADELRAFQGRFAGKVITAADPDYDRARSVCNGAA